MQPNLNYLLGLEPEEIIQWYKNKGLAITWNWYDMWQQAHSGSFTVAKILKLDLLQFMRNSWVKSQKDGLTFVEWRRRIEGKLKEEGWWGKQRVQDTPGYWDLAEVDRKALGDPEKLVQLGSINRLKLIYNQNANIGYNANRYISQLDNAADRPYLQYIQIERESAREEHTVFHLKVFRIDDPIWDIIYPPNGFNCGCYVSSISREELKAEGLQVNDGKEFIQYAESVIDESWRYNPARSQYLPNKKEYDNDLFRAFKNELRVLS